jgi:hypothetical protein
VATALTAAIRITPGMEERVERLASTAAEMARQARVLEKNPFVAPRGCSHARQAWNGDLIPCATPGCVEGVNTPSRMVYEAGQAVTLDRGRGRFASPVEPTTVVPLAPGSHIIAWIWRRREPPR